MIDDPLLDDSAEELFEDAPCGYLSTRLDGTIVKVNRTFEAWTGHERGTLIGRRRFQDLLSPGGRIYHETHYAPLLRMQGVVRAIAVELVRADGTRLPALVNSVLRGEDRSHPLGIRTAIFDATERRSYERELLSAQRREQEIARELQRGMLSGVLPSADGIEVQVAYRPGVAGLEIGGDWYDGFWLGDRERVGIVVGDVVGHGIEAAAAMSQLRSAVRAFASTGLGPAALVAALDGYARHHQVGGMATLVYAELGVAPRRLRYAVAGHPPPLVLLPGEEPCFAWDARTVPLDALYAGACPRDEATLELPAGATVLLYTDGLVESRTRSIDDGMERLRRHVAAHREDPIASLVGAVAHELHDPAHADDVCLLAARVA